MCQCAMCHKWELEKTSERAADDASSHTDVAVPVDRVETNDASDERRIEVVNALNIFVHVAAEILQNRLSSLCKDTKKSQHHVINSASGFSCEV